MHAILYNYFPIPFFAERKSRPSCSSIVARTIDIIMFVYQKAEKEKCAVQN